MAGEDEREPSLLFLPGAGADPAFWKPVGERLPRAWSKRYLGWPGIGPNPPTADVRSLDDLVALAEPHLVELAGAGRKVDVLAQSMGGVIAVALALAHPECIRRLVLTVTSGGMDVAALGAADWRPAYRKAYPGAAAWLCDARPNYSARLGEILAPTLLIWGDADPISPVAVGQEFQRRMPHAELVVIPGGTHGVASERADEVSGLILRHLASG